MRDDGTEESKRLIGKTKLGQAHDDSDEDSKASEDKWKVMKFDHLPKETPHSIQKVLKEEQKALLAANNELVEQRLLFEEENNDLNFFIGNDEDIVLLNASGTLMETKRSTLGLYKDSALAKQFDDPLWTQKDKTAPAGPPCCQH